MAQKDKEQKKDREPKRVASRETRATLDRIEDNGVAVLLLGEDEKQQVDIPVSLLPEGVEGGDHLRISISVDKTARAKSEDRIKKLQDQLKQQSAAEDKKDFKL